MSHYYYTFEMNEVVQESLPLSTLKIRDVKLPYSLSLVLTCQEVPVGQGPEASHSLHTHCLPVPTWPAGPGALKS